MSNGFMSGDVSFADSYRDFQYFYEMFYNIFGSEYGLTTDYVFTPEVISDFHKCIKVFKS